MSMKSEQDWDIIKVIKGILQVYSYNTGAGEVPRSPRVRGEVYTRTAS